MKQLNEDQQLEVLHSSDDEENEGGEIENKNLGVWSLAIITFFVVSGGPYGIEALVASAPPVYILVGLFVFPFLWSIPLSLVCAELSSISNDEDGGVVAWVHISFGKFWGYFAGFHNAVACTCDNALYPIICVGYLDTVLSAFPNFYFDYVEHSMTLFNFLVGLTVIFLVTIINLLGVEIVGIASWILTIVTISPFAVLFVIAMVHPSQMHPDALIQVTGPIQWQNLISNLIWNNIGWISAGFLAGEVANPSRNFPLAMIISALMISALDIFPTSLALCLEGYNGNWSTWIPGTFSAIAFAHGGAPLSISFTMAAFLSNIGIFIAGLLTSARGIAYMAYPEANMIPKPFGWTSAAIFNHKESDRVSNPWFSILFSSGICVVMIATIFDFQQIQNLETVLNGFVTILVYLSFLYLRFKYPDMKRTYRIPVNNFFAVLLCIPGFMIVFFLLAVTDANTYFFVLGCLIVGFATYAWFNWDDFKNDMYNLAVLLRLKKKLPNSESKEARMHELFKTLDKPEYASSFSISTQPLER